MATDQTATPPADQLPPLPEGATLVKEGRIPAPRVDRELEAAPRNLQNAAWVLAIGAVFPFMDAGGGWMSFGLAKVIGVAGCLVLAMAVFTRIGVKVPFGLDVLGQLRWAPRPGEKPKNAVQGFLMGMPTALHLLGLLLLVAAVVVPFFDPDIKAALAAYDPNTAVVPPPASAAKAAAEIIALLLGGCTLAHTFAYRKGGHFSPLYPFLFLGPGLMGVLSIYSQFMVEPSKNWIAILGSAICTVGAGIGVYTIGVAMVQAKKEGDLKKTAALEARKAARQARKGSDGDKAGARRS